MVCIASSEDNDQQDFPSHGIILRIPNEEPQFLPLAADELTCSSSLRQAVRVAVFGESDEKCDAKEPDTEETGDDECILQSDFTLLYQEKSLDDDNCAATFSKAVQAGAPCIVRVLFHLLGGKGGFGSLLRGQKGRGKKTTNLDSMRDLSGRRLRHSKAVERIKEWMEKQKREEDLVAALTGEGPELPKPVPQAESLDPKFLARLKRAAAERPGLVSQGMRRLQQEVSEAAGSSSASSSSGNKRAKVDEAATAEDILSLHGALEVLEGLSSPEGEEGQDAEGAVAPAAAPVPQDIVCGSKVRVQADVNTVVSAGVATGLKAEMWGLLWKASAGKVVEVLQIDANNQVKCRVFEPAVREVWLARSVLKAVSDEEAKSALALASKGEVTTGTPASGSSCAAVAAEPSTEKVADAPPVPAQGSSSSKHTEAAAAKPEEPPATPLQLAEIRAFASAEELATKVSAAVTKKTLQQLGMKCGGKPEERAARLFLLKEKEVSELPKSVFAAAGAK